MILAPSQHSSSSRWASAGSVPPPCVALGFSPADASAVAAGKRGAPAPQHGWAKRKRLDADEPPRSDTAAEELACCTSKRARASADAVIAPQPLQYAQPAQQPSRPPTLDEVHQWQSASRAPTPPSPPTSVVSAVPSAWVRVERPFGSAYERVAPVAATASAPLGACPDMDMDCSMDYESETHSGRAGSTPATPPDSPCDMWERIEGDGDCAAAQQAAASSDGQSAATLAWLQLQVCGTAHPHPYAASSTPSPNTNTFDAQNRVQLGSGYFARAFF